MNTMTVGQLEAKLLELFPREQAEPWDRTGLLAGDARAEVTGVCVALDPTIPAIDKALIEGANVLLTHHPAYLDAPEQFRLDSVFADAGTVVAYALSKGVALMNFHTAFDASAEALHLLPDALGLRFQRTLIPLHQSESAGKGYGAVCALPEGAQTVRDLAILCEQTFGRAVRVWGNPDRAIQLAVTAQGSAGDAAEAALAQGVDCLICGELKYHTALPYSLSGLGIIELGHDVSELPLAHKLAEITQALYEGPVHEIDQSHNWTTTGK